MEKLQGIAIRRFWEMGGVSGEIKRIQLVQLSFPSCLWESSYLLSAQENTTGTRRNVSKLTIDALATDEQWFAMMSNDLHHQTMELQGRVSELVWAK